MSPRTIVAQALVKKGVPAVIAQAYADESYQFAWESNDGVWIHLGLRGLPGIIRIQNYRLMPQRLRHTLPQAPHDILIEEGWGEQQRSKGGVVTFVTRHLSTEEVAKFFRGRANALNQEEIVDFPLTWAPAADSGFSPVIIGGDLPELETTSENINLDEWYYRWYDLDKVPVGGVILRVTSERTLYFFVRQDKGWKPLIQPKVGWARAGDTDLGSFIEGVKATLGIVEPIITPNQLPAAPSPEQKASEPLDTGELEDWEVELLNQAAPVPAQQTD